MWRLSDKDRLDVEERLNILRVQELETELEESNTAYESIKKELDELKNKNRTCKDIDVDSKDDVNDATKCKHEIELEQLKIKHEKLCEEYEEADSDRNVFNLRCMHLKRDKAEFVQKLDNQTSKLAFCESEIQEIKIAYTKLANEFEIAKLENKKLKDEIHAKAQECKFEVKFLNDLKNAISKYNCIDENDDVNVANKSDEINKSHNSKKN